MRGSVDLASGLQDRLSLSWSGGMNSGGNRNSRNSVSKKRRSTLVSLVGLPEEDIDEDHWLDKVLRVHESMMCVIIFTNCITMGIEMDYPWAGWFWVNQGMLVAYFIDIMLRIACSLSFAEFFRGGWNWLDSIIVISSILDMWVIPFITVGEDTKQQHKPSLMRSLNVVMRLPRLLRIFRILTVVKAVKPLYNLVLGLSEAMSAIFWFLILVCVFLYAFALIFHQMFSNWEEEDGSEAREVFSTVIRSFFSLFRVMSQDFTDLGPIFSSCQDWSLYPWYMAFQMCSKWLLLSTLTATVIDTVLGSKAKRERADEFSRVQDERETTSEELQEALGELTNVYDEIALEDLREHLEIKANADLLRRLVSKEPFEVLQDWEALQIEGTVPIDEFIEHLQAGNHIHNTAGQFQRLETRITRLQSSMDQVTTFLPMLRDLSNTLNMQSGTNQQANEVAASRDTSRSRERGRRYSVSSRTSLDGVFGAGPFANRSSGGAANLLFR